MIAERVPFRYEPRTVRAARGGPTEHEGWCDECGWATNHRDARDRARYHAVMTGHRTMSSFTETEAWQPQERDHTHPCGSLADVMARDAALEAREAARLAEEADDAR